MSAEPWSLTVASRSITGDEWTVTAATYGEWQTDHLFGLDDAEARELLRAGGEFVFTWNGDTPPRPTPSPMRVRREVAALTLRRGGEPIVWRSLDLRVYPGERISVSVPPVTVPRGWSW